VTNARQRNLKGRGTEGHGAVVQTERIDSDVATGEAMTRPDLAGSTVQGQAVDEGVLENHDSMNNAVSSDQTSSNENGTGGVAYYHAMGAAETAEVPQRLASRVTTEQIIEALGGLETDLAEAMAANQSALPRL
jgi:hypothetical protein